MSKTLWNALKVSPAILGAAILVSSPSLAAENTPESLGQDQTPVAADITANNSVLAQVSASGNDASSTVAQATNGTLDQINQYNDIEQDNSMGDVTSVSQLRDVQPTDWAFSALQSLVERYGCIEGYPDRTYRGNRAMTRYEFAAGLNSCLDRIRELIAASGNSGGVTKEDLERLQRLQEDFRTELASLRGRVDSLEARTTVLEGQQFSTTTKLRTEAIFALAQVFGDQKANSTDDLQDNTIFGDRVRIIFDSSFTGKDRLRTRIQARNLTQFDAGSSSRPNVTGTSMTRLSFDGNNGNNVELNRLEYRFPLTSRTNVFLEATGGEFNDNMYTFNPLMEASGEGSISRFGRYNSIYRLTEGGSGVTVVHDFSKQVGVALGYQVPGNRANNPAENFGLFDGSYAAIAQVAIRPSKTFDLGFTYAHSYLSGANGDVSVSGGTGSAFANAPFGSSIATSSDHFSLQGSFRLSPRFVISGWGGYTKSKQETNGDAEADIWNYAITLGLPDFGKKGNLLGFVVGQPPKVTSNDLAAREDSDTSYHLEAFYRIKVNDNISITPGAFAILNPEHNDNNDTTYVGTLRTTFRF